MLKKCKKYPDCDCFAKWAQPALNEVDADEAELFAASMNEIEQFCDAEQWLYYEPFLTKVLCYQEIIPAP
jgi:hypothetical protein